MEIQRIDFYVRIDPNSKRSQGEVTSSILKKKQIIIFSVRDWTKTAKAKHCFCADMQTDTFFFYILYILFVDLCILVVQECMQVVNSAAVIARDMPITLSVL